MANSGGSPVVRSLDPTATTVNDASGAVTTTNAGFKDGALNEITGQYYVMHSSDNVSVVTVANAGDSRAVLITPGGPQRLTKDHKPNDPEERQLIEDKGVDDMLITLADCLNEHLQTGVNADVVGDQLRMYSDS